MLMRAFKLYGDMGWPMDFQRTRLLVSEAATRMRGVDRKFGHPFVCSNLCVKDLFIIHVTIFFLISIPCVQRRQLPRKQLIDTRCQ